MNKSGYTVIVLPTNSIILLNFSISIYLIQKLSGYLNIFFKKEKLFKNLWVFLTFDSKLTLIFYSAQFSSVTQSCPTLCNPMNHSTPGLPVHHQLLESTQTYVHCVGDVIQPSHPLLSPSPPALNLSQHQGLFKWVRSSHQVAKVLEFQLPHQSFQWTPRTDLL